MSRHASRSVSENRLQCRPESQSGPASIPSGTLLDAAQSERGRYQSGAGIDAPRKHLHDDEHLYEGSDFSQREAQSRVVDVLLDRSRNVVESAAEDAA